jgi:hypothetical protein
MSSSVFSVIHHPFPASFQTLLWQKGTLQKKRTLGVSVYVSQDAVTYELRCDVKEVRPDPGSDPETVHK